MTFLHKNNKKTAQTQKYLNLNCPTVKHRGFEPRTT